jgi:heme/copper-type cytochrome/quinol oxidase subunit 2
MHDLTITITPYGMMVFFFVEHVVILFVWAYRYSKKWKSTVSADKKVN